MMARRAPFRSGIAVLAALAVLGTGVGFAQERSLSTSIVVDDSTATASPLTVWGHVDSPSRRCLAGRTVKLFEDLADGSSKLLGRDRSSRNGVWATKGDLKPGSLGAHVRVAAKRIGGRHRRSTCAGASQAFRF